MFTGLVEGLGTLRRVETRGTGSRLWIRPPELAKAAEGPPWAVELGASVAVSGCCLTVVACADPGGREVPIDTPGADMVFDLSAETLACTHLGRAQVGDVFNLERALQVGARLGGHIVSGHVDGAGEVLAIEDVGDGGSVFTFGGQAGFERYLVDKGSVTIDGVSLTVVAPHGAQFQVAVIPETLRVTTLGRAKVGDGVHLEADAMGKWVEHLLAPHVAALRERGV